MPTNVHNLERRAFIIGMGLSAGAGTANANVTCAGERVEIYPSGDKWRWRLFARNGEQIAEHLQPYDTKDACRKGVERVQKAFASGSYKIVEGCE